MVDFRFSFRANYLDPYPISQQQLETTKSRQHFHLQE